MPHIHAAAPVCRDKVHKQRQAAQELHPSNSAHKLFDAAAEEILLSLADAIERLADLAADFPQQNQ
ncbi:MULTISPECIES: hypothetical protein [unclassified Methylobacterium]|uniref:hypothetical protein n=1 Tax=unclassified Methylobacterium TaxID=2615210 RepID=UPI0036FD5DEF